MGSDSYAFCIFYYFYVEYCLEWKNEDSEEMVNYEENAVYSLDILFVAIENVNGGQKWKIINYSIECL